VKLGLLALAAAACTHTVHATAVPVAKASSIPSGVVTTVVELGDTLYVFGATDVAIMRNGVAVATAPAPAAWTSASTIPALDGDGRWVVATADGKIWRITSAGELQPIADRLGLDDVRATKIDSHGATIAVAFAGGIAVSTDSVHLQRYRVDGDIAVARDRLAVFGVRGVELWDLRRGTRIDYGIGQASGAFLEADGASPRLLIQSGGIAYVERDRKLEQMALPERDRVAVSGARAWVRGPSGLYVLDRGAFVRTNADPGAGSLYGSPSGDVWFNKIAGSDQRTGIALERYSLDRPEDPRWQSEVAPVFERVCSHCHLPGGSADIDLSTPALWRDNRDELLRRVVVTRTMPPAGSDLTDAERAALEAWLRRR
jgi:mono/diheme cytochrome c family protein